jgi:hypothetical protein
VVQDHADRAFFQDVLRTRYDVALQAGDKVGIDAFQVEYEKFRMRYIDRKAALDAVRAEFDALKAPRRPRRSLAFMSPVLKHAIGVLWALLTLWGGGFIYMAATASSGAAWWDQGVMGAACLVGAFILFRIWNRAMGDIPWWPPR